VECGVIDLDVDTTIPGQDQRERLVATGFESEGGGGDVCTRPGERPAPPQGP
jgi:hypothetical protein